MAQRFLYLAKYYLFWLVFFQLQKPLFMLCQLRWLEQPAFPDFFQVMWHALPLDASVAAYVTMVYGLILVGSVFQPARVTEKLSDWWTELALAVTLLTFVADTAAFPSWGYHLDKTVFVYLRDLNAVWACLSFWQELMLFVILIVLFGACLFAFFMWMKGYDNLQPVAGKGRAAGSAVLLFVATALFFLPARGSLTASTMNTGRVYFSDRQTLNVSAVNPLFNILESMGEDTFNKDKYTYLSEAERASAFMSVFTGSQPTVNRQSTDSQPIVEAVVKVPRPNIIFLILESFSSNAMEAMPSVRRLAEEGVYFANAYASSYRTDRGLVAVLSAFPGQPTSSLMTVPSKSQQLPVFSLSLQQQAGYRLKFWYGGDEDFTNMRSYLVHGGFLDRVCDKSFSVEERLSKWGAQDHVLFARLTDEILSRPRDGQPALDVVLSLSSHEPFEVPATRRFDSPYLNSIAYTDSCIGALADALRQSDRWDSTLLVLVADHGYPYPGDVQNYEPRRYHIPMLLAGGAVRHPLRVERLCSQTDLVPTLLAQLGLDRSAYVFGRDIFDAAAVPFAFYSFNDGFGLMTPSDTVVIDAKADRLLLGRSPDAERQAKAYIQTVMQIVDSL